MCVHAHVANIYASKEEEEVHDVRFDKVLSIRDGKVDPLLRCMRVGLPFVARSARFSQKKRALNENMIGHFR